jgi:glycosyltransferase involved in cell wall biosynthesis
MKVGCLLDSVSRNAGGLFESVRRLAQSLRAENSTVSVFSLDDEHSPEDKAAWNPLPIKTFPPLLRKWGFSPRLGRALLDAQLDLVLTHGLWKYSSVACHSWHRRTHRPYIIHPHGMLDPWAVENSKWKKRVAAALYEDAHLRGAACIRALCDSEAQSIRAYGLRNPICVIPNGIDLPEGYSNAETLRYRDAEMGGSGGGSNAETLKYRNAEISSKAESFSQLSAALPAARSKTLLYLGRLHPKKNLEPLIEAWALVLQDCPVAKDWTLAIAGWDQGGYEQALKVQSSELKVQSSVRFLGPQFGDDKAACYARCDAFVLPSLSEGLPMVVLEAWAYAKPVLMTNECNLPEGFTAGAAVRIGTAADSIAAGLRQLMEMSDAERASMGARGRALAAERFSWKEIGAEMRRVCDWAVGGGPAPASVRLD